MITRDRVPIEEMKNLEPSFCSGYGWLSIAELNLIDPYCARFKIVEQATFVSGDVFVSVVPILGRTIDCIAD